MNLIKLYTAHGSVYVDAKQLANRNRTILTIYTARGNRLADVGSTKAIREGAEFGVHRENLYASQDLADAASDRIYEELFGANAVPERNMAETSWTITEAEMYVQQISAALASIGVTAEIVGSVAKVGLSSNDLDLALHPIIPMSFEAIMDALYTKLLPMVSIHTSEILEAWGHQDTWFISFERADGRVVEFYVAEAEFPLEIA